MVPSSTLFLKRVPTDPCPSGTCPNISQSPSCMFQALFQLLPLFWVSKQVKLFTGPLKVGSLFPLGVYKSRVSIPSRHLALTELSSTDVQSQKFCRLNFPMWIPPGQGVPNMGLEPPSLLMEDLCTLISLPLMHYCTGGSFPNLSMSLPLLFFLTSLFNISLVV